MAIIEDKNIFGNLKSKIWMLFDILKSENSVYSSQNYYIILYFISAFKDNIISTDFIDDNQYIKERLIEKLRNTNNEYYEITFYFKSYIEQLSDNGIRNIILTISEIDKKVLTEHFSEIFDSVLFQISKLQGRSSDLLIQSKELINLMISLADLQENSIVYNPFSGLASFGIQLNKNSLYIGQEINSITWAVGYLRLMANSKNINTRYTCEDSISHFSLNNEKYDLIISTPPIGMRLGKRNIEFESNINSIDQFLIEKGIKTLKQNGKLITLLSTSFLYRGTQEKNLREYLVEMDLIDTIIALPNGLMDYTSIPLIVLVLNKAKELPGKVKMIDAKSFVTEKSNREKKLDDKSLINFINSKINDDSIIKVVDNAQIYYNDFNLSVARYFKKEIQGVMLGDIIETIRGQRRDLPEKGKLIRISDLKNDNLDFRLKLAFIDKVDLNKPDIQCISESCLLVTNRMKTLKPTYFDYEDESIYVNSNVLPLKIKDSRVDIAYLINELQAEYVQEQIDSLITGAVIPFIRREDLMNIIIKLPSQEEQLAKVEGVKQAFVKAKEEELKLQKEILGVKEDSFNEYASMKHTFRQFLGALKSNVSGTRKFIHKKNGQIISLDDIYSEKLNQSLRDHLISVEETITSLSKLLELDRYASLGSQVETLNLIDLVKNAHHRFEQDTFKFDFKFDEVSFSENDSILEPLIEMDKEDFFMLFSNIVSNAINHGFKDKNGNRILSKIRYDSNTENCVLEVSNNGIPMPEKFTFKHLTTRGEKTTDSKGTGIGGADIKNIVNTYNGSFDLINDIESPFPVTYRISFPIIKQNNYEI